MENPMKKKKTSFADHPMAAWWDYTKNGEITPAMVGRYSSKTYFFYHTLCGHIYEYSPSKIRDDNMTCFYCGKVPRFCGIESCTHCFKRSFASFELNGFVWHPTLNLPIFPFMVSKGTEKKCWFFHEKCNHSFELSPSKITSSSCSCPYCVSSNSRLCGKINCTNCFERSFASFDLKGLITWLEEKNGPMINVAKYSSKKFWFTHDKCGHEFQLSPNVVTNPKRVIFCPFCGNSGAHCGSRDCLHCKDKSILSLEMSKHLSVKNDKNIWMLAKCSDVVVIFDCPYCKREYQSTVSNVYYGKWCGCKKHKGEEKLYNFLIHMFPNRTIQRNVNFEWCKNEETDKFLPFDFCIDEYIVVELDGQQHFSDIPRWKTNAVEKQERDIYKMTCALSEGLRVIRLYQVDVWKDKNNWAAKLKALIEDDSDQLAFVTTDNQLVTDTYAMYASKWEQFLLEAEPQLSQLPT